MSSSLVFVCFVEFFFKFLIKCHSWVFVRVVEGYYSWLFLYVHLGKLDKTVNFVTSCIGLLKNLVCMSISFCLAYLDFLLS